MSEQQQGTWADLAPQSQQGSWADLAPQVAAPTTATPPVVNGETALIRGQQRAQFNNTQPSLIQGFLSELQKNARANPIVNAIWPSATNPDTGHYDPYGVERGAPLVTQGVQAIGQGATNAASAINQRFGLTPTERVENAIAPSSVERKAVTANLAPELAKDPALVAASKNKAFDDALFSRYQDAQKALDVAEKSVPQGTTVAKKPLLDEIDKEINALQIPTPTTMQSFLQGQPGTTGISGHPDALKILQQERDTLNKLGDQIPFDDLLKYRRQLDKAIQTAGGFKETASAADRASMEAKRFVANTVRGGLANSTGAMSAANKEYSLMRNAIDAAGLDSDTGRRLSTVGKAISPIDMIKDFIIKKAIPGAAIGGLGTLGYDLYKSQKP